MHDEIIDLRCANPQALIDPLTALAEVRDVTVFGSGLHIVTPDAKRAKVAINRCIEELDGKEVSMETIFPNMEDVFISLIEEVDRNNKEQKDREADSI